MDSLDKIFEMQKELAKRIPTAGDSEGMKVSNLCTALIHETVEMQRMTNWKWWKKQAKFDKVAVREEYADMFHFIIQLAIELDMTPEDVIRAYEDKNKDNHDRVAKGYFSIWR